VLRILPLSGVLLVKLLKGGVLFSKI